MAKRKPTVLDMERALGYAIDQSVYSDHVGHRFYSNLTPISDLPYDRVEKEYASTGRAQRYQRCKQDSTTIFPTGNETKTISWQGSTVTVQQLGSVGFYKFLVDAQYEFGLDLSFLFTIEEAFNLLSMSRLLELKIKTQTLPRPTLQWQLRSNSVPKDRSRLLNMPQEIRDKIYRFTCQDAKWQSKQLYSGGKDLSFCRSLGDPSGFYFPLGKTFTLLAVNRQMRQEALVLAYRCTRFYLTDIEDLTRFLLAVGRIGRENIESLDFAWESQIDLDASWRDFPDSETNHLTLPAFHISRCIQLLKQCKRLKSVQLRFERCLITDVPLETFKTNAGILLLCSLQGIDNSAILSTENENMSDFVVAQWLRKQIICK
ncbi:hypothetical protein VHEMI04430 [[Torrubiella] hemipterigena]|uniref:Uncharacterized protein n=1 Tax=[Torrubiella] hemipterigena TaxID=1531966 RepID=A0A0A1TDS5_9HYPO|nr:hypothetical protein VHEMI04430 [[Torrubiella] hemipterigena]